MEIVKLVVYNYINKEFHKGHPQYQECVSCVMDTTDGSITFDKHGICNYCRAVSSLNLVDSKNKDQRKALLDHSIETIKKNSRNRKYDCILGISGGLDSSYLALLLKEYNLRVLAVHVDGGWNSELAVNNIKQVIEHCNFDLYTHVVNWEAMRNLQLAFFEWGISNLDIPQDHAFSAVLHWLAQKHGIKYFMNGGNLATESIMPSYWQAEAMDSLLIKDIYKKHVGGKIKDFKLISFFQFKILFRLRGYKQIRPLNYIPYGVDIANQKLEKIGWKNYKRKHGESIFTKFFSKLFSR